MRVGPRRRAAAAAQTALVALLVAGAVCGSGYGLQRIALRAPTNGELLTARAVGVLLRYRYIESDIRVAGRPPLHARCLQGWLPGRGGRGAQVVFSDGERLLAGDRQIVRVGAGSTRAPLRPVVAVELAGCPRPLATYLSKHLIGGTRVHAVPSTFGGRPAFRMHVRTLLSRFDVFVDRQTFVPLGVRVEGQGIIGWSTLRPTKLTPALQHALLRSFGG